MRKKIAALRALCSIVQVTLLWHKGQQWQHMPFLRKKHETLAMAVLEIAT
jgi:hypothetical protein